MKPTRPSVPFNGRDSGQDMGKLEQLNRRTLAEQVDRLADNLNTNAGILEAVQREVLAQRETLRDLTLDVLTPHADCAETRQQVKMLREEYIHIMRKGAWGRFLWLIRGY